MNDATWKEVETMLSPETKDHYYQMDQLRKRLIEKEIGVRTQQYGPPGH